MILVVLACVAAGATLHYLVVLHPGDEIKFENISKILGKESPVLYNDGKTRLGVFFDEAHRQYVSYDRIPLNFINALVASEDNRFFSHFGFDVFGILRAVIKNVQAGRIVQGGSTLTQQTAKNLFKREDRSLKAKLKELIFALRLEYHYPKEKIFEFYANQFYVSGNGHGLGVAARYYFNKKPEELSLLECAYIAGSVKRPNYYNPFLKNTEEKVAEAKKRGKERVNYVLSKMLELKMISEYEYGQAKVSDVKFNKGQVGYALDYVMEMVRDAVSSTRVSEALALHDIDNISTSGVRIITTVEQQLQEQTLYSLRHELSRLDTRLLGYEREEVQKELAQLDYRGDTDVAPKSFLFGEVVAIEQGSDLEIEINFAGSLGTGVIDRKGLSRLVLARLRWQKHPWSEAGEDDLKSFLEQLKVGDKVWVSVRSISNTGKVLLDLEKFPTVNGGALIIKEGRILAMAGGVENRFYNRAIYAKRTMGSSFKPFVYSAAVQLGWNTIDQLNNSRNIFVFQGQPYFPRPDHHSPFGEVSMSWAGVNSENVASVWLLAHLCDKLSEEEFYEVASHVDLAPRIVGGEQEPYSRFMGRIRDKNGIVITMDTLRLAAFRLAVKNVETDLIFEGRDAEYNTIARMHYGQQFDLFAQDLEEQLKDKELSKSSRDELKLRIDLLKGNYLELEHLRHKLGEYESNVKAGYPVSNPYVDRTIGGEEEDELRTGLFYDASLDRYFFMYYRDFRGGLTPVSSFNLFRHLQAMDENQQNQFWQDIILGTSLSIHAFDVLSTQVARELDELRAELPYSMKVLANVPDYRILVGLRYLIALARECGITSTLEPVLSFPLGSNVVTLFEALRMYEALVRGDVTLVGRASDENNDLLAIIDRIESANGEVLYTPERKRKKVFAPQTSLEIGHILENIVKHGTGRYADSHLRLMDDSEAKSKALDNLNVSIPVLGKTGTANRYTNAAFLGYLPGLTTAGDALALKNGYSVGVYVGFDNNLPMRKGVTRITGAAGALPTWTELVAAVIKQREFNQHLDAVDLSFNGLVIDWPDLGQKNVEVSPENGLSPGAARLIGERARYTPSILTFGNVGVDGRFRPDREFLPFWRAAELP